MITIQNHLFQNALLVEKLQLLAPSFAIVTDDTLASLYGVGLQKRLGTNAHLFSFPAGEAYKTRATKEKLEDALFEKGIGRQTALIALGGGVVTDLAGYLASTYCRGLPLALIPTTLMGMVDACIGGKNGVNIPGGKNMIGTIYPPEQILIDPQFLKTLPLNEIKSGAVEMIKHGLIADATYFELLENHADNLFSEEPLYIEKVITESCRIKTAIVSQDEKETGVRHLLNFGHTIGHALEIYTNHALSHGEAVAIGMIAEGHLSVQTGHLEASSLKRIQQILQTYKLPLTLPSPIDIALFLNLLKRDKKTLEGKPRFVLLEAIGKPVFFEGAYCTSVEEPFIKKTVEWINHALHTH